MVFLLPRRLTQSIFDSHKWHEYYPLGAWMVEVDMPLFPQDVDPGLDIFASNDSHPRFSSEIQFNIIINDSNKKDTCSFVKLLIIYQPINCMVSM